MELRRKRIIFGEWKADKKYLVNKKELSGNWQIARSDNKIKSVYLIATRDLSNLWLQFFLSQNQGFMRLFEKTVLK